MSKLLVVKDFDYRWPSGSLTAYKAGPDILTVKREVTEYATKRGFGKAAETAKGGEVTK